MREKKLIVTDVKTSIMIDCKVKAPSWRAAVTLDEKVKYCFYGMVNELTKQDVEDVPDGILFFKADDIAEYHGITPEEKDRKKVCHLIFGLNEIHFFANINIPVYEKGKLPEGIEEKDCNFILVEKNGKKKKGYVQTYKFTNEKDGSEYKGTITKEYFDTIEA